MRLTRIAAGVSAVVVLGGLVPATTSAAETSTERAGCWEIKRAERRFARRINAARARDGRRRLRLDPQLSQVARKNTRAMVRHHTLHHSPWSQLQRRVTNWTRLGENVGVGGSVRSLHRAFMASSGHRDNIVGSGFRHVGIGTRKARGRLWVTVVFQSRGNPGTTLPAPNC